MGNFYQYLVKQPERWDNIANAAYGDPSMIAGIVEANPDVLITPLIPAGTILNIPIITEDQQTTLADDLPPWA